jgi:hypothetical protein
MILNSRSSLCCHNTLRNFSLNAFSSSSSSFFSRDDNHNSNTRSFSSSSLPVELSSIRVASQNVDSSSKTQRILFLHGLLGAGRNWRTIAMELSHKGIESHLLDLRNHGSSPHSEVTSVKLMADDVLHYIQTKLPNDGKKPIVLGHSMVCNSPDVLFLLHSSSSSPSLNFLPSFLSISFSLSLSSSFLSSPLSPSPLCFSKRVRKLQCTSQWSTRLSWIGWWLSTWHQRSTQVSKNKIESLMPCSHWISLESPILELQMVFFFLPFLTLLFVPLFSQT